MGASHRNTLNIFHLHTGGSNGCDIELLVALTPRYSIKEVDLKIVDKPEEADVIVVTGPLTTQIRNHVLEILDRAPKTKIVVLGHCGLSGGIFLKEGTNYAIAGPVNKYLPTNVHVPGCPPEPAAIIKALTMIMENT